MKKFDYKKWVSDYKYGKKSLFEQIGTSSIGGGDYSNWAVDPTAYSCPEGPAAQPDLFGTLPISTQEAVCGACETGFTPSGQPGTPNPEWCNCCILGDNTFTVGGETGSAATGSAATGSAATGSNVPCDINHPDAPQPSDYPGGGTDPAYLAAKAAFIEACEGGTLGGETTGSMGIGGSKPKPKPKPKPRPKPKPKPKDKGKDKSKLDEIKDLIGKELLKQTIKEEYNRIKRWEK